MRELWAESRNLLGLHSLDDDAAAVPRADLESGFPLESRRSVARRDGEDEKRAARETWSQRKTKASGVGGEAAAEEQQGKLDGGEEVGDG